MRRMLAVLGVVFLSACQAIPPSPTSPGVEPPAASNASVAMISVIATPLELPNGGGTVTLRIYAAATSAGTPQAGNAKIQLTASTGRLKDAEIVTDWTGNAATEWSGEQTGEITATANGVTSRATIRVAGTPVVTPPAPTPNPNPTPTPPTPTPPSGSIELGALPPSQGVYATEAATYQAAIRYSGEVRDEKIEWDFDGDGRTDRTGRAPSWTFATPGTKEIAIRARAEDGATGSGGVRFTVLHADTFTVSLAASSTSVAIGTPTTVTATVTSRNGFNPVTDYQFDCDGAGPLPATNGAANAVSCSYPTDGSATASVTASTSDGRNAIAFTTVTVVLPALSLSVSATPSTVSLGTAIAFTTTLSGLGPTETVTSWAWDFQNDGIVDSAIATATSHTYATDGAKTVKLTIVTSRGRTITATTNVTITP